MAASRAKAFTDVIPNEKTKSATRLRIRERERCTLEPSGDTVNINKRAQRLLVGRFYQLVSAFQLPFLLPGLLLQPVARLHVPEVLVFRFVWPAPRGSTPTWPDFLSVPLVSVFFLFTG